MTLTRVIMLATGTRAITGIRIIMEIMEEIITTPVVAFMDTLVEDCITEDFITEGVEVIMVELDTASALEEVVGLEGLEEGEELVMDISFVMNV